ncbi:MAG: hypothetical protein ABUL72_04255 [Armatimonadota bacterium]
MLPETSSLRLSEQLLLFTHLIINAVEQNSFDELDNLFSQRQAVLDQLIGRTLDLEAQEMLGRVAVAERKLKGKIEEGMAESIRQINGLFQEKRGIKAYKHAA